MGCTSLVVVTASESEDTSELKVLKPSSAEVVRTAFWC